jgi:hypothetical protein
VDHFNFTAEEVRKGWVGRAAQGIRPAAFHYCYLTWIADILTLPDLPFATTQVSSKLVRLTREPSFRQSVARLRDLNLIGSGPASRAADVIESELVVASSHLLRPIESVTPWWVANFTCVVVAPVPSEVHYHSSDGRVECSVLHQADFFMWHACMCT